MMDGRVAKLSVSRSGLQELPFLTNLVDRRHYLDVIGLVDVHSLAPPNRARFSLVPRFCPSMRCLGYQAVTYELGRARSSLRIPLLL
jgi:hypothetical protein